MPYATAGSTDSAGPRGPRGALLARMSSATFPFLSANIRLANGARPPWPNFFASIHIHRGSFDVGVVGYTTRETPSTTSLQNVADLDFSDIAAVASEIRALRASGASPVVLLAHASLDGSLPQTLDALTDTQPHGELADLVTKLGADRPDVIIAGHRHAWMLGRVNGIPAVSSDQHGVGLARIRFCRSNGSTVFRSIERIAVVAATPPRTTLGRAVTAVTAPWIASVKARADVVVTTLPADCPVRNVNGTAGAEQIAVAMLQPAAHVVRSRAVPLIAIVNTGAIRAPLRRGVVRYADLFRSFPFEATISICTTTRAGFARVLRNALRDPSTWKEFPFALAGAEATVQFAHDGTPSLADLSIGGASDERAPVALAIPDFILEGGDGFLEGVVCTSTSDTGMRIRDAWSDELARDPEGCGGAPHNVIIRREP